MTMTDATTIGVVSDTHGRLRPEVVEQLRDVQHIIHAGDVGNGEIIPELAEIAPVVVVRGNVDVGDYANAWPDTDVLHIGDRLLYVVHRLEDLDVDPHAAEVSAVIFGHTHQPESRWEDGVLYLNPGSVGPRRFSQPVSMAILTVSADDMDIDWRYLD